MYPNSAPLINPAVSKGHDRPTLVSPPAGSPHTVTHTLPTPQNPTAPPPHVENAAAALVATQLASAGAKLAGSARQATPPSKSQGGSKSASYTEQPRDCMPTHRLSHEFMPLLSSHPRRSSTSPSIPHDTLPLVRVGLSVPPCIALPTLHIQHALARHTPPEKIPERPRPHVCNTTIVGSTSNRSPCTALQGYQGKRWGCTASGATRPPSRTDCT